MNIEKNGWSFGCGLVEGRDRGGGGKVRWWVRGSGR